MNKSRFSAKSMAFTAIMAAVICIGAPFCIPVPSGVPLSLASFAVMLSGALLGKTKGTLAVCLYILLGAVGLPVFSGFMGGVAPLVGLTGGFIVGYVPCAFVTGLFTERFSGKSYAVVAGMVLGTLLLYLVGTLWFVILTGSGFVEALLGCVVPFLPGDAAKITAACVLVAALRKKLTPIIRDNKQ